jgi:transcriptional regulator with XRE-family HTH domain
MHQAFHDQRRASGLSANDLAARVGMTADEIECIEEGGTEPTIALLHRLASALGRRRAPDRRARPRLRAVRTLTQPDPLGVAVLPSTATSQTATGAVADGSLCRTWVVTWIGIVAPSRSEIGAPQTARAWVDAMADPGEAWQLTGRSGRARIVTGCLPSSSPS